MGDIAAASQAAPLHAHFIKTRCEKTATQAIFKLISSSPPSSLNLHYARTIFDSLCNPDSHTANTIIRCYASGNHPLEALLFFIFLRRREIGPEPDNFTYPFLLKSCSRRRNLSSGRQLHGLIFKQGLSMDRFIQNSLIHMYARCSKIECALTVFDRLPQRDVVSWTSIIDGCSKEGLNLSALNLFDEMLQRGFIPNEATVVSVLRTCADSGALTHGQRVHKVIKKLLLERKVNVATALIDMYSKCGRIEEARNVFDEMPERDSFAWTVMISGFASHGKSEEALSLFNQMIGLKLVPDERTMTVVLSACRHSGLVEAAKFYFQEMKKYGIVPGIQHYGSMVALLARAGELEEAEELVKKMPIEPDEIIWRTLAWGRKIHGDSDMAEILVRDRLLGFGSRDSGSYVLLGNICSRVGNWEDRARVWAEMSRRGIAKPPAKSRIEIDGEIHEFEAGDSNHPQAEKIYEKLDEIMERLREEEYQPRVSEVLMEVDEEEKAFQLRHHSEKLAVAFGLIRSEPGEKIVIFKNLRSCEDCHNAMKIISRIYDREIIVRDRIRFHHFSCGICSCGDFW